MNRKILLLLPISFICLSSCAKREHFEEKEYFTSSINWTREDFRILQLGDIHFSQTDYLEEHYKFMDLTIQDAIKDGLDLIVVNGDMFTYATKNVARNLFNFVDSYNIPWTFTYGNHDDQGYFSDAYLERIATTKNYPNIRFVSLNDDIPGRSNFAININKDNKTRYQVYCFDSHSYRYDEYFGYDYVSEEQVDWYERMVNYTKDNYGDGSIVPSVAFMHIPVAEYKTARVEGEHILGDDDLEPAFGSAPLETSYLFPKMVELGSTKAIMVAHDHKKDTVYRYKGIDLGYGLHSTNRIYYDDSKLGGTVIVLHDDVDNTISYQQYKHTYKEVK